ncbi:uncharacterized protein LOC121764189 [Salvia splendens]|uniref:uncharacterized protein LOC121764189 n=1 Tax=Salvia splendens TaxID=180675 RepID=UPI001C26CCC1|nr:uncharacterized protein LOC121764189 [Salvia splendens]
MTTENAQASSKKGKNIGDAADDDRLLADEIERIRNNKKIKIDDASNSKAASKKGKKIVVQDDTAIQTPTLAGRSNTDFFVDMLESLNKNQRRAVREIEFGALLNFNIRSFPRSLAYYLIYNFNHKSSSIKLNSGESLFLDDEDVHITLGFSIESLPMNRIKFQKNINIKTQIARFCKGGEKKMVPAYVVEQMMKDEEGGEWFKWNFMVLVEYALINTPADGNVSPQILDYIADVEKIKQYNWCSYVISKLLETQKRWKRNTTKIFTGPVIFVVACYVDKIVFEKKMVPRCYPTVKGWTAELLKERQRTEMNDSDFGLGHKYDRYKKQPHEENDENDESEDEDDEPEDVKALNKNDHDEEGTISGS